MATQLGVAPPPAAALPPAPLRASATHAALAATQLDAMPSTARVDSALAVPQFDAMPSTARVDPALAATQLEAMPSTARVDPTLAKAASDASPPSRAAAAFADTQLAVPRPPEVAALFDALDDDAPTVVQVPEFMLEPNAATQAAAAALPQAPLTTRSPDLATEPAAPQLQVAAPTSASQAEPPYSRAALSSEAFATTQDTVPPLPMSGAGLRLPSPFDRWSRTQLIGLGGAAFVAACLPLIAVGALLTSGVDVSAAPVATTASVATTAPAAPATPLATTVPVATTAPAPVAAPVAPPAAQAPPTAAQTPPAAQASAIPWLDRASASTPSCDSLAIARPGPKGFLLQQAIKQGQRELIRGNVTAAHAAFCEAVALGDPNDAVLMGLAQVLLMQADANAALKIVEQLLTLKPNDRQALDLRGDILIRLGRADEARQTWYRAAGASRGSASLMENLRRVNRADAARALRAGDLARADRLWRRVIALDVRDVAGCAELAAVLAKNGEVDAARRWLAYADTLDPAHPRLVAVKSSLGS